MAKKSKYNRARIRSRVRRQRRHTPSWPWVLIVFVIVVVGVVLIAASINKRNNAASGHPLLYNGTTGDHWHAAFSVNVCGQWLPNAPQFESAYGLHTHGDGIIHIHPFEKIATGKNATVGRYFESARNATASNGTPQPLDWHLSADSFQVWDGVSKQNGDKCGAGKTAKPGIVMWSLGKHGGTWEGKPRTSNLADYHPQNGDIIGLYFLPKGSKLPEPPNADKALDSVGDLNPGQSVPTVAPSTTTTPTTTPRKQP
jgi:hypothetical protein